MSIAATPMSELPLAGQPAGIGKLSGKTKAPANRSILAKPDSASQPEAR